MKTLSKDDNNGLKKEKEIIKYFLFIFFIANILYSQTELNNFGITGILPSFKGYKKFSVVDIDRDGQKDLLLYGNKSKNFVYHKGTSDSSFSPAVRKFFFYPIDDFKFLNHNRKKNDYFLFVSRNKRLVGLGSFTKSLSLQLLHTLKYKSYPSEIKIVDLNSDGNNEALIFGDNFDGIELITNNSYKLSSTTIVSDAIIKDIDTIDFNHDQKVDLVAIDLLHNSINFYENLENMTFAKGREIFFDETISKLQRAFFNNDEFIDLLISKESGFEILLGDSVLSFANRISLDYSFSPNKFLFEDVNQDSIKDIITLNVLNNLVNIKPLDTNRNSINYFFNGISDLQIISDSAKNTLILLSSKGKIQTISSTQKWGSSFSFSTGGRINKINYMAENKENGNLYAFDKLENSLRVINIDSDRKFSNVTSVNFVNTISHFSGSNDNKILAGYLPGNRLIEVLLKNSDNNISGKRNYFYSTHPIDNLFIHENNNISVTSIVDDTLYLQLFENKENEYKPLSTIKVDSSVICYNLSANGLFYWTKDESKLELKGVYRNNKKTFFQDLRNKLNIDFAMIIDKKYKNDLYPIVTLIKYGNKEKLLFFNGTKILEFPVDNILFNNDVKRNKLSFISIPDKGSFIIFNNSGQGIIQFFKFDFENNILVPYKSIEAELISDYLVQQFFGNIYLVFTDTENNIINFELLDL